MMRIDVSTPKHPNTFALVDDEDFERLSRFNWVFAGRYVCKRHQRNAEVPAYMHKAILRCSAGEVVDHIDGNTLNNQKSNLRLCSQAENMRNRRLNRNNKSGYKGVAITKYGWQAHFRIGKKLVHLGTFSSGEEAAKAYDAAAIQHHGEFASTNAMLGLV